MREDPAPRENIIRDHRVAVVSCGAVSAEGLEQGIAGGGPIEQIPALIPDREAEVVPQDVLGRVNTAFRVRRNRVGKRSRGCRLQPPRS